MNIKRLAYLAIKEIIKNDRREGEIKIILNNKGYSLSDAEIREVAEYISANGYGKHTLISMGRVIVRANSKASDFVNRENHIAFDERLKLIYEELLSKPDRKGELESVLKYLGLDYNDYDLANFVKHFKESGEVGCSSSKDRTEITLTQKGIDFLMRDEAQHNVPFVQNIAIGNGIIQSSEIGGKGKVKIAANESVGNRKEGLQKEKSWLKDNIVGIIGIVIAILLFILGFIFTK